MPKSERIITKKKDTAQAYPLSSKVAVFVQKYNHVHHAGFNAISFLGNDFTCGAKHSLR